MRLGPACLRRMRGDRGQVMPLVVICSVVLIGFTGLAIDMARVWVTQQELQRSVDAAALAAGQDLPDSTESEGVAVSYSGQGTKDAVGGWGITPKAPSVTFECVPHGPTGSYTAGSPPTCLTDSSGDKCKPSTTSPTPSGVTTCNAVNVTETATVKTGLLSVFFPSFTVSASSTAGARGTGVPNPMNVFVILDTTQSMTDSCSSTVTGVSNPSKLDCAKNGVRSLLQTLEPCATNLTSCGSDVTSTTNVPNAADEVGIMVVPALSMTLGGSSPNWTLGGPPTASLTDETNCGTNESFDDTYPPWTDYTYSAAATDGGIPLSGPSADNDPNGDNYLGYQAVGLTSDYRTSDSATSLNLSSGVVDAVDWGETGCTSFPGSDDYGVKDIGGQGSYLAGAITEAQYKLATAPARVGPNGQAPANAIIILSDGELNDPKSSSDGVAPSSSNNKGWTDSTPCEDAYDAAREAKAAGTTIFAISYDSSGNCDSTYTAAGLMQDMASATSDYFSETNASDLGTVFGQVGTLLTGDSALIPDCTQLAPAC
jgi:hypothetical protein